MIAELYEIDRQLVDNNLYTEVTIEIGEKNSQNVLEYRRLAPEYIISESLEIKQSICDNNELKIGGCIPSQLTLNVMDVSGNLTGKWIVVKVRSHYISSQVLFPAAALYPSTDLYPNANTQSGEQTTDQYALFVGTIYSCNKTNNYKIRKIVAFDRMHYASTVMCKDRILRFINQFEDPSLTLGQFWANFQSKARMPGNLSGINWNTELLLVAGDLKKVVDNEYTFLDYYADLCELNAVFLIEDLPTDLTSNRVHPRTIKPYLDVDSNNSVHYDTISSYSGLTYEDYLTREIRYVQFYYDGGVAYLHKDPYADYSSYISDNPLMQCVFNSNNAKEIIRNLSSSYSSDHKDKITGKVYEYRPFKASIFNRWWVQIGDRVKLPTNDPDVPYVESIVLSRKLKGMYGMKVEIEAKGVEIMGKETDREINE